MFLDEGLEIFYPLARVPAALFVLSIAFLVQLDYVLELLLSGKQVFDLDVLLL